MSVQGGVCTHEGGTVVRWRQVVILVCISLGVEVWITLGPEVYDITPLLYITRTTSYYQET